MFAPPLGETTSRAPAGDGYAVWARSRSLQRSRSLWIWRSCPVRPRSLGAPPPAQAFYEVADITEALLSPLDTKLANASRKGINRIALVIVDIASGKPTYTAQFANADVWQMHWANDDRLIVSAVDLLDSRVVRISAHWHQCASATPP